MNSAIITFKGCEEIAAKEVKELIGKEAKIKDTFLDWCIGGVQETGDDGYPQYWMNLPKWTKGKKLFTRQDADNASSLLQYDKVLHLFVKGGGAPKTVDQFSGGADAGGDASPFAGSDSDEDPFAVTDGGGDEDPFAVEG